MSDAIHPNMGGHQFIAEQIAKTMTGQAVSMEGTPPPSDPLRHTKKLIAATKPIHVFAMSPADELIASILQQTGTSTTVKATPWVTANKSLAQFESQARATVRKMKPDLVIVAVPSSMCESAASCFVRYGYEGTAYRAVHLDEKALAQYKIELDSKLNVASKNLTKRELNSKLGEKPALPPI